MDSDPPTKSLGWDVQFGGSRVLDFASLVLFTAKASKCTACNPGAPQPLGASFCNLNVVPGGVQVSWHSRSVLLVFGLFQQMRTDARADPQPYCAHGRWVTGTRYHHETGEGNCFAE